MPKIHKPAFLKKKKDGEEGEEAIENDEDKKGDGDEDKENPDEKKDGDAEEGDKDKKTKIIDSLKNIKSQVHVPAFLKKGSKEKDVENGDKEESKELLEKKEGQDEGTEENKDKPETEGTDEKSPEDQEKTTDQTDGKASSSRGTALLESIRSVASHVPALFRKSKDKVSSRSILIISLILMNISIKLTQYITHLFFILGNRCRSRRKRRTSR